MRFVDFVDINPNIKLQKNLDYPFVDMNSVKPGYRYVTTNKKKKFKSGGAKFETNDTLFARITPCLENGKIAQVIDLEGDIGFGSTEFFVFRSKPEISTSEYVYYLSLTKIIRDTAEKSMTGASGRQRADINSIKNLEVYSPDIVIQNKITSILRSYDNLIQNNLTRIKTLEKIISKLYREWFVKFQFPGNKNIKFINSKLGKVPKNWETLILGDIAKVYRGKSYSRKELELNEGKLFINLKCINKGGGFRRNGIKRYTGNYKSSQIVSEGSIVIAITDMSQERELIGQVARIGKLGKEISIISLDLANIVPLKKVGKNYLYSSLRFSNFSDIIQNYANGVNVLHLSIKNIENFKISFPPERLRKKYEEITEYYFQKINVLENSNEILKKTRDLILPKLMSGNIDISNLNIKLEDSF